MFKVKIFFSECIKFYVKIGRFLKTWLGRKTLNVQHTHLGGERSKTWSKRCCVSVLKHHRWMLAGGKLDAERRGYHYLEHTVRETLNTGSGSVSPFEASQNKACFTRVLPCVSKKTRKRVLLFSYLFLGNTQVYNRVGWAAALMEQKIMCFGSRCPRPGKNELGETGQVHQLLYNWPAAKPSPNDRWQNSSLCGNIFDGSAHVLLSVPMSCRGAAPQLLLMLSECWQCTSDWLTDLDHLDSARMVPGRMQSGLDDWAEWRTQMRQFITFTVFFVLFFLKKKKKKKVLFPLIRRAAAKHLFCMLVPVWIKTALKGPLCCHSVCI